MIKVPEGPVPVGEDATGKRFLLYTTKTGTHVELTFDGDEPWFSQAEIASIFGVSVSSVNEHIAKYISEGELDEATIRKFRIVRQEGQRKVTREIDHYGLDVAFYVGYRVNSSEGKLFRRWATQVLIQLAKHGFVVDKRKLKGAPDRLAQLREIIRELRSDEANLYAELRRILSMCRDYDPNQPATRNFFANFQNRLLYAITGRTAAEILVAEADASKPNMGLQCWDEENDYPLQSDALKSKNYLGELQLRDLNRLVGMVLDFFEDQTEREWLVSMQDADARLEEILTVNRRKLLKGHGVVKHEDAEAHVKKQYKEFDQRRRDERKALAVIELNEAVKQLRPPRGRGKKGSR